MWEHLAPKRKLILKRKKRWPFNLSVVFITNLFIRFVVPFSATGVAYLTQIQQFGILNHISLSQELKVLLSILALDLTIYIQHYLFHHVPILWRFHKVHHIDQDFDVTTGIRFHPVEIILSLVIKCGAIMILGAPIIAVILFELILNITAMFNHGNVRMPFKLDLFLRFIIVTPDMHRIHHSVIPSEYNKNFGFNVSFWDRIFRTYQDQPRKGHAAMTTGLESYQDISKTGPFRLLILPFLSQHK
jgi:sterol desaturase/sphingolipid hydroxylase (fatty acid hydroxylase superfamily)